MELSAGLTGLISFVLLIAATIYLYYGPRHDANGRRYRFPPGPKGLPLVGNFFQLPHSLGQGRVAKKWADKYGEM